MNPYLEMIFTGLFMWASCIFIYFVFGLSEIGQWMFFIAGFLPVSLGLFFGVFRLINYEESNKKIKHKVK